MSDLQDLQLLVAARTPIIFFDTAEPDHAEELFRAIAGVARRPLFRWTLAKGLLRLDGTFVPQRFNAKPSDVLAQVLATPTPGIYLLLDLQSFLDDPLVRSQLREIAEQCKRTPHTLVVVAADAAVPAELQPYAAHFQCALPTLTELQQLVYNEAGAWSKRNVRGVQMNNETVAALARQLLGLKHGDALSLVRGALADGTVDQADVAAAADAKYKLLDRGGVLSFELKTPKLDEVAGLANLKRWLAQRREPFLADQPIPGLDPPKGVLLLGVQGGGKSLAAKACAGAWAVPLLRLDFATLYNKYYGETERNLRDSLKTAGAMAPCVLWIDEIEKGLATDSGDEGVSRRVLGTLLTWMAERTEKVFLVATANEIEALPPELLRKGRFDEIFFVDLPDAEVRAQAFAIPLRKRAQDPAAFDLPRLVAATAGFTGAEIEQAIVSALYAAHARRAPLGSTDILAEVKSTRPLSVVMAEKVAALRAWAAERTVPAG